MTALRETTRAGLPESGGVLVLHKTLDILESIKEKPSGVRLSDLARSMDMPKATVYRILATLESRGFLDRAEDGGYRMARRLFELQPPLPIEQILNRVALPPMQALARSSRETVDLGVLDGGEVAVTETVESFLSVRMGSNQLRARDNRHHLHTSAIGKVLLAALPEKEALRLIRLKGLPRLTPHSIVSSDRLMWELKRVRQQGYAIENQENEMEGRSIAAPVFDRAAGGAAGRVVAAIGISGPAFRLNLDRARFLAPKLKLTCTAISIAAGG